MKNELPTIVRRFYASDPLGERTKGEICEVIGSCDAPQYLLLGSDGEQFWWRQDLTTEASVSESELIEYWARRAKTAESKLRGQLNF